MLDIMYEIPKDDSIGQVIITREYIEGTGGPRILLRGQEIPLIGWHSRQGNRCFIILQLFRRQLLAVKVLNSYNTFYMKGRWYYGTRFF